MKVKWDLSKLSRKILTSLVKWREMADCNLDGFDWEEGILRLATQDELGIQHNLLVVPDKYRREVLRLAHDLQGHIGIKKVKAVLRNRVSWPNLHSGVVGWCDSCDKCQRHKKGQSHRAPMQEVPVCFCAI